MDYIKKCIKKDPYIVYNFDSNGKTALHMAVACGNSKIALYLLEKRADPDMTDDFGWTPLA